MSKIETIFNKLASGSFFINDAWFKPRQELKTLHSGNTFVRDTNVTVKTMFEGQGLKKFDGKFTNLDSNKGPVNVENVVIPHIPKIPREKLIEITNKLRNKINANTPNS